jgi:hypothetical protein
MAIRIVMKENIEQGFPDSLCVHGEWLERFCQDCYKQCRKLPIDLDTDQTLAITLDDDGMEDV